MSGCLVGGAGDGGCCVAGGSEREPGLGDGCGDTPTPALAPVSPPALSGSRNVFGAEPASREVLTFGGAFDDRRTWVDGGVVGADPITGTGGGGGRSHITISSSPSPPAPVSSVSPSSPGVSTSGVGASILGATDGRGGRTGGRFASPPPVVGAASGVGASGVVPSERCSAAANAPGERLGRLIAGPPGLGLARGGITGAEERAEMLALGR